MVVDLACFVQLAPSGLREAEVRGVVAVEVPDLAPPDLEGRLTDLAGVDDDAGPRADGLLDLLAEGGCCAHRCCSVRGGPNVAAP